ncbi:type II toxin-antitoxin system HicB family antitoxin [Brachyspira innocens]|uniref:Type II toxin-antitoxin system HicB family antitoxin n=1 Tax=Brachyspira innocens TaxID=13264 RepID=A0ABT8Z1Y6_9SPIR|nr:type II toxin-antitoxin system HicB family antitoxin [Brachyspira innocens]MDO6992513.1 type II toxin-antitoxin system HicB family antitoxin [Brachyspira innocens]MDO7021305.1 type II toxin-antitoxin system HicB family antitoxin [Brachyspira innocens]
MKKKLETFVANIYKTKSGYNSTFYDFDGCVSAGKTLEEIVNNSKIALQMHIDGMIEDGEKIPKASSLEKIIKETEDEPITRMLIEVKVSREKKKRIDITLDESLIKTIDNLSSNRSEFITLAAKNYISNYYK